VNYYSEWDPYAAAWLRNLIAVGLLPPGDVDERDIQDVTPAEPEHWPSPLNGFWRDADWLLCRDGLWRPVEPGTFPLAHGVPARVGKLRAWGNSIVPEVAAEVIREWMA
jgi:hypothetical protein